MMVGQVAKQPSAQRTHQESQCEKKPGVKLLHQRIGIREESASEIERKRRVCVKIIPLDQIARRTDEDGLDASPHVGKIERFVNIARPYCYRGHDSSNAAQSTGM